MQVEVWADVVCPWCYIGKTRLDVALAALPFADSVDVVYRSFQLDPRSTVPDPGRPREDLATSLGTKYGGGREAGLRMIAHVSAVAAGDGLLLDHEHSLPGNTHDAHRLLQAAYDEGGPALQASVLARLLRGYFSEREPIDDPAALQRLSVEGGLDAVVAARVLAGREYAERVHADQAEAAQLGATGVPFVVVDRRYGVSGAQPVEMFKQVLERAWADRT